VGEAAGVGPGDDNKASPLDADIFDENDGGDEARGLIGMGSAQDEHSAAFFFPPENVHSRVTGSVLEGRKVGAEHFLLSEPGAREDRFSLVQAQETAAGEEADGQGQQKKEQRRELTSLDFFHGLFNQKEPEQEECQDKDSRGLAPEVFLAEEIPDQVKAQVEDHQ
jgi:hypothetical protein